MSTFIPSENIKKALAKLGLDEAGVTSAVDAMTADAVNAGLMTKTTEPTATLPDFEAIIKTAVDAALAPVVARITALEALPAELVAMKAEVEVQKTAITRASKTMGEVKEILTGATSVGSGVVEVTDDKQADGARKAVSKTEQKMAAGAPAVALSGLGTKMFPRS